MTAHTLRLGKDRTTAHRWVDRAPEGWVMKLGAPTRSDEQNRKLWPMLTDLRRQVPELAGYQLDDIKLRFLNALGVEMRMLPVLEGQGMFPIGMRSSTLTKEQFSGLLELINEYGARHGVQWSNEGDS